MTCCGFLQIVLQGFKNNFSRRNMTNWAQIDRYCQDPSKKALEKAIFLSDEVMRAQTKFVDIFNKFKAGTLSEINSRITHVIRHPVRLFTSLYYYHMASHQIPDKVPKQE
uniref:Uncharacterized protein n=1 Tax=Romanomermis culicivorax TaxID=13658 RepID=A0A915HK62_ROMCU